MYFWKVKDKVRAGALLKEKAGPGHKQLETDFMEDDKCLFKVGRLVYGGDKKR